MLKKGDRVANLTFTDSDGRNYRLADFEGRRAIVFFFYPMDFSPGCTKQACHFRDYYQEIKDLGAEVFGASTDSAQSHSEFKEKHALPYPLISDADRSLGKVFGTGRLGGLLGNKRVTFVVAADGEIVEAIHSELSMTAHVEQVLQVLKTLGEKAQ